MNFHNLDYWPGEDKLLENNIPFFKFEQKADELVYLNTGCFHFVQSNGYCENVSWNVGQPTFSQLAILMVAFDHYMESNAYNQVPVIQMVWTAVKNKKFVDDPEMYQLMRNIMIRSLAHTRWYLDYPRCEVCGTEVKRERMEHEFCSECDIPEQELCNIFDAFVPSCREP